MKPSWWSTNNSPNITWVLRQIYKGTKSWRKLKTNKKGFLDSREVKGGGRGGKMGWGGEGGGGGGGWGELWGGYGGGGRRRG